MARSGLVAGFAAVLFASSPAVAQTTNTESAVDAIVGSTVEEKEASAAAEPEKVIAAIDRSVENAEAVRKLTKAPKVEIVFLADAAQTEGGPPAEISEKLKERDPEVKQLRQEIEGNALLYHAIDSRQVLLRDVLAIEIGDDAVIVYAAAKPAG